MNTKNEKEVKAEVVKDKAPAKVRDAYEVLSAQIKQFDIDETNARIKKTKALGALEVMAQLYPKLQEDDSES